MKKREILVVTETLGVDGPERVISELVNEWDTNGYEITVVVTRAEQREATYRIHDGIRICQIHAHAKGGPFSRVNEAMALRKILRRHPEAVGVSFLVSTSFSLAVASIGLKNRIVLSERNDPRRVPFTRFQRKMRDLAMELADVCVFQTQDAKSCFSRRVQHKGTVIDNPVSPSLPRRFIGERRKAFVAAGRLAKQKNYPVLIRAFAKLVKEYPDYRLIIYGEGTEREALEKLIRAYGLSGKAEMPGFSDEVYQEMADCAAYVSSSDYEGMSNAMLEALAMGMPVICTDCPIGGARAVIRDRQNGLLVPVGDAHAFYQAMKCVVENPEWAEAMGRNAYELRNRLNIHAIANRWIPLLFETKGQTG